MGCGCPTFPTVGWFDILFGKEIGVVIEHNCAALVVAHNHPSGVAEPSAADRELTERLRQALALVEIRLLDHVVSTLPAEDEMYIGIRGGPPPIGPLWFVPDDEAAQADVVQLFEDLVDVSPDDLKRSSERQVDHYKLLSTDLPADPSEAMVDLGTGLLRGAGAGYEQIEAFIKENCGMPPYR